MSQPQQRVAVVTGAAQGIGLAIAERLGTLGHRVVLVDRDGDKVGEAATRLADNGAVTLSRVVDVADEASVGSFYQWLDETIGRLDILVNNAGISPRLNGANATIEDTTLDLWNLTLAVNLTGTFLMCRLALLACCRFRGHREKVFHESGGGLWRGEYSVVSSRSRPFVWFANEV